MIGYIEGKIAVIDEATVTVVTNSGVGYDIFVGEHRAGLEEEGDKATYFTKLKPTENSLNLYGFNTKEEKTFFSLLNSVSGVGPKSAMNILTLGSMNEIKNAIDTEDKEYLKNVKGIGPKTADRILVELQEKVESQSVDSSSEDKKAREVIEALKSMGYSKQEAQQAVTGVETEEKSIQEILKEVLKKI